MKALAVAALLVLTACGNSPASRSATRERSAGPSTAATGTRVLVLAGRASTRIPARWFDAAYRGEPATVFFPIVFVGTVRFTGRCARAVTHPDACDAQTWFPPHSTTPVDGVIAMWAYTEFPSWNGDGLVNFEGTRTTVAHRRAKVYAGAASSICPPGAETEIDGRVLAYGNKHAGERLDLDACLGPKVSAADRRAVYAMLAALRITG